MPKEKAGTSKVIVGWLELALLSEVVDPASESGSAWRSPETSFLGLNGSTTSTII